MRRATKASRAGQRYLELQRAARRSARPTDELIQLYALECFLDRLVRSRFSEQFVLKGGVLLSALDARRPTRDIDFAARALSNSAAEVLSVVREIAGVPIDDGIVFAPDRARAEVIREGDDYSGIRVTLSGALSRAAIRMHVDINVGDPIWPPPQQVVLPRLLAGELLVRGYPLEMVLAEKIVTAISRGSTNTRWRDFVDLYTLLGRHDIRGEIFRESLSGVARYRSVPLIPLRAALAGYADLAQRRWLAWLRKQRLDDLVPNNFSSVLDLVASFADPVIDGLARSDTTWVCRNHGGT